MRPLAPRLPRPQRPATRVARVLRRLLLPAAALAGLVAPACSRRTGAGGGAEEPAADAAADAGARTNVTGEPADGGAAATEAHDPATEPATTAEGGPVADAVESPAAPGGEPQAEDAHRLLYRVPIEGSPWKGAAEPLAVLIELVDFDCPNTARMAPVLDRLVAAHPDELRVVYKAYPIPGHGFAPEAAVAAAFAEAHGRFWEMHDVLLADPTRHAPEELEALLERLGLDLERYRKTIENQTFAPRIAADVSLGHRLGVTGTPSFVLNGRRFEGTVPEHKLEARIVGAIAQGRALLDAGVPRAEIYETLVRDGLEQAPPRTFDVSHDAPTM